MSASPTVGTLWRQWRDLLAAAGMDNAQIDAKLLVGWVLNLSALNLATREREPVAPEDVARVGAVMERRLAGEPVGRIMGEREFYGLVFRLNRATLEPRADTELLVDLALGLLPGNGTILDLGTGTGCIPIAVLHTRPDARGTAIDLSPEALEAARGNAERHGVAERLDLLQGSWFEPLAAANQNGRGKFDLVVSNPPYIETAELAKLSREVREHDPVLALDGGHDGLTPYPILAAGAQDWLKPGGNLLLEIGSTQGEAVAQILRSAGYVDVAVHKDLAGLDRVVSGHHLGDKACTAL
ncbi:MULTISPECIES: peptide chain release factor N(5)-glutamine methyltransferase [unclassified Devosia]|uniref:peptide chain release factor N(5)-glutamine methyltransferase n=1 Tax=unclassified Devosia TaxID=196773 RepID=UPI0024A7712A|nr:MULTISPECIES: peptide chain release factor N(5)-glutamine methyltransferase [unclassified Devosia]